MSFEEAQRFWETCGAGAKARAFAGDAVLRFFDPAQLVEVLDGKLIKFDVDKIAELQDRVDKLGAAPEDEVVREVFAAGSTRALNVRSHKLSKVVKDRLMAVAARGELPAGEEEGPGPQSATPSPQSERAAPSARPGGAAAAQVLRLALDLPEGARLNVRAEPSADGEIVAVLEAGGRVQCLARHGDWARVQSDDFGEAWVLTCTPDRMLMVEAEPVMAPPMARPAKVHAAPAPAQAPAKHMPPQPQLQPQPAAANPAQNAPAPAHPQELVGEDIGYYQQMQQMQQMQHARTMPYGGAPRTPAPAAAGYHDALLTPMAVGDAARYVSLEEHNRLRFKVAQLEADMRALRLLLRSWSLDTPSQPF
jgi:hypothetical protein